MLENALHYMNMCFANSGLIPSNRYRQLDEMIPHDFLKTHNYLKYHKITGQNVFYDTDMYADIEKYLLETTYQNLIVKATLKPEQLKQITKLKYYARGYVKVSTYKGNILFMSKKKKDTAADTAHIKLMGIYGGSSVSLHNYYKSLSFQPLNILTNKESENKAQIETNPLYIKIQVENVLNLKINTYFRYHDFVT